MSETPEPANRRALPSVGKLLENPRVVEALSHLPRTSVVNALRAELTAARVSRNGSISADEEGFVDRALAKVSAGQTLSLQRAINATGIVLHTGLGRAVLAEEAQAAIAEVAAGHSTLEIDPESGRRGSRQSHISGILCELTGAEAAHVVNNNAGATFLSVMALAAGREVIISRGELVEIGGSFRLSDIIKASGATLIEVGTTNRTRLKDFSSAISERTGLLLRCHPSNFKVVGFTEEVSASDLAKLGKQHGIPVMDDLGSGAIIDTAQFGTGPTITLRSAIESGCDIVTASGDKLLGGPQAGIILGRKEIVEKIATHQLARALRIDKLTLAALEATLKLYRDPERAVKQIPTLRYLSRSLDELRTMANRLQTLLQMGFAEGFEIETIETVSQVGGGSLPGENLPTVAVSIRPGKTNMSVDELARRLRQDLTPIFGRIHEGALLLDPRTVEEWECMLIVAAFDNLLK
jgi:L-seryl-tRNA(Ser) seleniumtransferase